MGFVSYPAYLRTPHWQELRLRKLREVTGHCEVRGCQQPATQVHHSSYVRCPWYEHLGDLVAVCRYHHAGLEQARRQHTSAQRRGRPHQTDSCTIPRRVEGNQLTLPLYRRQ